MTPGHTLSVDGPRPHTWCYLGLLLKSVWPGAIHLKCVAWGHQLKGVWHGAIYFEKCVAWGRQLKLCDLFKVCGLGPSTETVWPGAIY